ncbi:hypothetical protein DL764_009660 [Monosporascus ibericus]|uniref:DDE-1 domain-containing protein n=1 Tax=Monosporascus ibericus TaxID=155417 RepID=A0A4Q4SXA6_9PEZI|nr:hypothetical protein DL764_009660 [Monosporascus ibericus]
MDETPLPFEYVDGYTYSLKGLRTVTAKSDRSSWDKRQATLILFIWVDGRGQERVKPIIIFRGAPGDRSQIPDEEKKQYAPGVKVLFNEKAYNNEKIMTDIVNNLGEYTDDKDTLLTMDVAAFHKTPKLMELLRSYRIITALIPPGCTSLLQPLDTAINGPFKEWLAEFARRYIAKKEDQHFQQHGSPMVWSVSDRRIMITHIIQQAWERLCKREHLIRKAFRDCGISIRPDGSEDDLINIKDIDHSEINFTGWETAENSVPEGYETISEALNMHHRFRHAAEDYLRQRVNWKQFTIPKLMEACKANGLKAARKKDDLVKVLEAWEERIIQEELAAII